MKKALQNALFAELYIVAIVLVIRYGVTTIDGPDTVFAPILMLSLFVLSAAVMGYLFVSEPLQLYFSGHAKEAVRFFFTTVVIFAGITLVLLLGLLLFSHSVYQQDMPIGINEEGSTLATYFQNTLFEQATAKTGAMPIEGYDAQLLMSAFPGFEVRDFDGVETFEGVYIAAGGELTFSRSKPQPISSAERTISTAGYDTLLANVADRLDVTVATESDIDTLITYLQ